MFVAIHYPTPSNFTFNYLPLSPLIIRILKNNITILLCCDVHLYCILNRSKANALMALLSTQPCSNQLKV